jgi:hypothetical protein
VAPSHIDRFHRAIGMNITPDVFLPLGDFGTQVNATLFPIIFGVVLASLKLSFDPFTVSLGEFNVYGFAGAMVSNLAFAMRSILIKNMTADEANCKKKNLSSANVYAVGTAAPFLALTSLFLISLPNLPLLCQL